MKTVTMMWLAAVLFMGMVLVFVLYWDEIGWMLR